MIEIQGNIFDYNADAICVTTNNNVTTNSHAIMGGGVALAFAKTYPNLLALFGGDRRYLDAEVFAVYLPEERRAIVNFPTKLNLNERSPIDLIIKSTKALVALTDKCKWTRVILPRPGALLGGLDWLTEVKPVIEPLLDNRFVIISYATMNDTLAAIDVIHD